MNGGSYVIFNILFLLFAISLVLRHFYSFDALFAPAGFWPLGQNPAGEASL